MNINMNKLDIYMNRRKKVKTQYGIPFECVELVRRFYNKYYGLTFPSVRDAYEIFKKIDTLIHTGNHQLVLLQTITAPNIDRFCIGDTLFWNRNQKNNYYGHVGIIVYSDWKTVVIAQQNQDNPIEVYNTKKLMKEMNKKNSNFLGIKRLPDWIPKPPMIYVKVI
jgi:hypothetical protein